jgi:hypothetical protein
MNADAKAEAAKLEWACRQIESLLKRQGELEVNLGRLSGAVKLLAESFGKYVETREAMRVLGL